MTVINLWLVYVRRRFTVDRQRVTLSNTLGDEGKVAPHRVVTDQSTTGHCRIEMFRLTLVAFAVVVTSVVCKRMSSLKLQEEMYGDEPPPPKHHGYHMMKKPYTDYISKYTPLLLRFSS